MTKSFGFLDAGGVLENDPSQKFFGIGLLKVADTAALYEQLALLKSRSIAAMRDLKKPFEFHFSDINRTDFPYYRELIDLYFKYSGVRFCAFVIDKTDPAFHADHFFDSTWDALISYSKLVVEKNIDVDEDLCLIADYITKPNNSTRYYENELKLVRKNGRECVFNACLLESHASLYIQIVDVLLGVVLYDFKRQRDPDDFGNYYKNKIVDTMCERLGVKRLADSFTVYKPNYFSVWPFKPK
jgi:hypothetical protein